MHQNFQDQLIPSYFIYWVQKPCWIKGRSEFRSNNQCFFEKKHCGMQRDRFFCITNQPILLTLEATPLIPTYPFVHLLNPNIPKKKQPVTSNSIPGYKKNLPILADVSVLVCLESWLVLPWDVHLLPRLNVSDLLKPLVILPVQQDWWRLSLLTWVVLKRIPLSLPSTQKKLNIDTKSEALQIFMEIFLVWESWKNFIVIDLGGLPGIFPWESCYYFLKPWIDSEAYIIYKNLLCLHSFRSESQFKASLRKGYIPNSAYHTSCGKPWPNSSSTDPVVPPGKKPKQAQRRCRSLPARVGAESCHSWKSQLLVATF